MTEAEFQQRVIDTAKLYGWMVHHTRTARTGNGWRTPIAGDKGAPDLLLARRGVVIHSELKTDRGRPAPEQVAWLKAIGDTARLWRPRDWEDVLDQLKETA